VSPPAGATRTIRCREGLADYDATYGVDPGQLTPGISAILRVKDEARSLPWVLPRLLASVEQVVLVDNKSSDETVEVAERTAAATDLSDRLEVHSYPFEVSRCGPEHLRTPPDSVHSLTHFYNWSFSWSRTTYTMKWDGDMVLTVEGASVLSDLGWQLTAPTHIVSMPHPPLYVESETVAYLDTHLRNTEPWILPTTSDAAYVKGFDWEVRRPVPSAERMVLPDGLCFELKWLDSDEFAHWTSADAFHPVRSPRKVREHTVFHALREGRWASLDDVDRIEAPDDRHVIDYVAEEWMLRMRAGVTG
jgi:glycosyltransferase involved in cell wall biosynthesis